MAEVDVHHELKACLEEWFFYQFTYDVVKTKTAFRHTLYKCLVEIDKLLCHRGEAVPF